MKSNLEYLVVWAEKIIVMKLGMIEVNIGNDKGARNNGEDTRETRKLETDWYVYMQRDFSRSVVSDSLQPHESQHTRLPCPSPTPRVHPDSRPSSQWCHPAISSSVVPFSSCPQSLRRKGDYTHPGLAGGKMMIWEAAGDRTREKRKTGSQRSFWVRQRTYTLS